MEKCLQKQIKKLNSSFYSPIREITLLALYAEVSPKKSIPNTDVILRVRMSLTHTSISARWVELKKIDIDQKENLIWKKTRLLTYPRLICKQIVVEL